MTTLTRSRSIIATGLLLTPLLAQAQTQIIPSSPDTGLIALILVISSLFVLGIIAIALLGPQWFLRNAIRERNELVANLLAAGKEVPPELLKPPAPPVPSSSMSANEQAAVNKARSMRRGVLLLSLGAGIAAVAYFGFDSPRTASWGLLFLALSLASFINARFFSGERTGR